MTSSTSCLQSTKLTRGSTEKTDATSVAPRRPRSGQNIRGHFDALVVADEEREPEQRRDASAGCRPPRSRTAAPPRMRAARGTPRARAAPAAAPASRRTSRRSTCRPRSSRRSAAARAQRLLRRRDHRLRRRARQASEIARRADPLIARAAGQVPAISTDSVGIARGAPRRRSRRQRRAVYADDRRAPWSPRCAAARCRRRRTAGSGRSAP